MLHILISVSREQIFPASHCNHNILTVAARFDKILEAVNIIFSMKVYENKTKQSHKRGQCP